MDATSSSEFKGFTKEDLEPPCVMGTNQPSVLGTNKEDLDPDSASVMGINSTQAGVLGNNIYSVDTPAKPIDYQPFNNDVLGRNHIEETEKGGSRPSSSSSEFEGFMKEDLKPLSQLKNESNCDLSFSLSDPSDLPGPEEGDTTPHSSDIPNMCQMSNPPNKIITKGSKTPTPILFVEKLWKNEALNRKYSVSLNRLNKQEIYNLSHPLPDWDNIDPYSGLEEYSSDSQPDDETTVKNTETSCKLSKTMTMSKDCEPYHMRSRTKTSPVCRKSSQRSSRMITYAESDSHSSDSNFEPCPKPIRNGNIGLHEPTQSWLRAQKLISVSNAEKGSDSFPIRAVQRTKHVLIVLKSSTTLTV